MRRPGAVRVRGEEGVAFLQGARGNRVGLAAGGRRPSAARAAARGRGGGGRRRAGTSRPLSPSTRSRRRPALGAAEVVRGLTGDEPSPRMLQARVSFRVVGPALAHLWRAIAHLEDAVNRALVGVTTSPALIDGTFVARRLRRVRRGSQRRRDARRTAARRRDRHLAVAPDARPAGDRPAPQLSASRGATPGLVTLHKRAAGRVHEARRSSPASLGAAETSAGQEDVQSYALDALRALRERPSTWCAT